MTDEEWSSSRDGIELCRTLWNRSDRKRQLIRVAIARRVLSIARDRWCEPALAMAEAHADDKVSWDECRRKFDELYHILSEDDERRGPHVRRLQAARRTVVLALGRYEPASVAHNAALAASRDGRTVAKFECEVQATLVREVFCDTLLLPRFPKRWRTADALGLARGIYDELAFDRLPLLADTLMDAGCEDEQILGHCRRKASHLRGCWLVDLVLGKD